MGAMFDLWIDPWSVFMVGTRATSRSLASMTKRFMINLLCFVDYLVASLMSCWAYWLLRSAQNTYTLHVSHHVRIIDVYTALFSHSTLNPSTHE